MFGFLRRWACLHRRFTYWHIVNRKLWTPMFGGTIDEVQQRECVDCGYIQRAECKVKKS